VGRKQRRFTVILNTEKMSIESPLLPSPFKHKNITHPPYGTTLSNEYDVDELRDLPLIFAVSQRIIVR
jgi:hypothetical protein